MSPRFLSLLAAEELGDKVVLDVGCGGGRLALWLAPRCRRVVGIDRDEEGIAEARRCAAAARVPNADFHVRDAEAVEYTEWAPEMAVAHLCMSDAIIARSARALPAGGCLVFVCFHTDQWRETGRTSRFAYDGERLRELLGRHDLQVEHLEVEREVQRFDSEDQALAYVAGFKANWEREGRWERYVEFLRGGGQTLTRSHLIAKARRR